MIVEMDGGLGIGQLSTRKAEQLSRIGDAGLIEQGRVFLLSFEAIRLELGDRWRHREEIVWETFDRDLTRAMPAPDQFVRVGETTILAAISSTDAYSGQVCCADVFRRILAFFLGRNQESDLSMSRVSSLSADTITSDAIDPSAPPPSLAATNGVTSSVAPERWDPPLSSREDRFSFLSERDGLVEFDVGVTPVWRLDSRLVAAYSIRRRLPRPLSSFSDRDQEAIDLAVADFLTPVMMEYQREGGLFAILCPFTFATLSTRSSRLRLLHRCAGIIDVMRRAVVLEIDGLVRGSPAGRIRETLAMCRPMARVRTLSTQCSSASEMLACDYGAEGISLDARSFTERQMHHAVIQARKRTSNIVVHGVPRHWSLAHLKTLGATHVTEDRFDAAESLPPDQLVQRSA